MVEGLLRSSVVFHMDIMSRQIEIAYRFEPVGACWLALFTVVYGYNLQSSGISEPNF